MGYEYLKSLFEPDQEGGEPKRMGYDELIEAIDRNKNLKIVNIREGGYVSKEKYDRLLADAEKYKTDLSAATERLNQGTSQGEGVIDVDALKKAHSAEIEAMQAELNAQVKTGMIRDYLEYEKFTSRLAKTALIKEMSSNPDVFVVNGQLVGAEKAMKHYKDIYADAFQIDKPIEKVEPTGPMPLFTPMGGGSAKPAIPRPIPSAYGNYE